MKDKPLSTLHALAMADADMELGGRFTKLTKPQVVGASPYSPYPDLPAGNPFKSDPCGVEPLVDGRSEGDVCLIPTGELFEQERSRLASSSLAADDVKAPTSLASPSGVGVKPWRRI